MSAYGLSTSRRDDLDQAHALDQHFESLATGFAPRPPVGGNFRACAVGLLDQALRFQYPQHPDFGADEVRPAALKRVLQNVLAAAADPDRRAAIDRTQRDEMRRIAVPLALGEMGETHFVLDDHWREHFQRLLREAGNPGPLTVGQLRAWSDEPEPRGLVREVQDLVILTFAVQTNRVFYRHGGPEEPTLGHLDDVLELQEADLPEAEAWEEARDRLATLFGRSDTPAVRNAPNAARLQRALDDIIKAYHAPTERYARVLEERLDSRGIKDSARLETARAAQALMNVMASAEGNARVTALNEARLTTSASAMAKAMHDGEALARALEDVDWQLFETARSLREPYGQQALALHEGINEALGNDEHVVALRQRLRDAQTQAHQLIRDALQPEPGAPPGPGSVTPPDNGERVENIQKTALSPAQLKAEVEAVLTRTQDDVVTIDLTLVIRTGNTRP